MKTWLLAALFILPGGSLLAVAVWAVRWKQGLAKDRAVIDAAITKQRDGLYYTYVKADESLAARARVRQEITDTIRKRSASVASGSASADVLKTVRRA